MLIRSVPPKIHFDTKLNKLEYSTLKLTNNIPLYYIKDNHQSVCGIEIVFDGGKISESTHGAAFFSTNLLKSGIEGNNSNEINEFFALRGAFVQVQSGLDNNSISLYCLSHKIKETLPFFLELFISPLFPQDQLEKLKIRKEQELNINELKSNYWANTLLKKSLFNNHPYGRTLNKKEVNLITRKSLEQHWNTNSLNRIQFITATGNFNLDQIKVELESKLSKRNSAKITNAEISNTKQASFSHKKLANNQQTSLKIGLHTIGLKDNDYAALSYGCTLLGGYFGSRLMQSIREDKGLTYGINSSILHLKNSSYLQISADLKIGAGEEVRDLIHQELHKLIYNPIPDTELNRVKNYLIGEYKSNTETIFDKISKVKFLKIHNLSNSYFINHFNSILELNSEQLQKILKNQVVPTYFHTVIVE